MLTLTTFNDWLTIAGYLAIVFFFFVCPIAGSNNIYLRGLFLLGSCIAFFLPYLVSLKAGEVEGLAMSTGAMVQCFSFILLFYCYFNKDRLLENLPYFFLVLLRDGRVQPI